MRYLWTRKWTVSNLLPRKTHTKRSILSEASRVLNPLSPLLIRPNMILQDLWQSNVGWNDNLPDEILDRWLKLWYEIDESKYITLDRWLECSYQKREDIEVHRFSYASQLAYSVFFVRVSNASTVLCRLISSKTRVASLKTLSLTRLELLGPNGCLAKFNRFFVSAS